MKLSSLAEAIARLGEHASQGAREQYIGHTEELHQKESSLPGKPTGLATAHVDSLQPKRIRLTTRVNLSEGADGEPQVTFGRKSLSKGSSADIEIEWERTDAPEAVHRVRDQDTNRMTREIGRNKD